MNWNDIRIFLALARTGAVRAAGHRLGISHSTVLRRLEALEADLGVRLFDRTPEGYVLTAAGRDVLSEAKTVADHMGAIERQLVGRDDRLEGDIKVTMPDGLALHLLMEPLTRFMEDHPAITIEIDLTYDALDLSRREADVALRFLRAGKLPPPHLVGRKAAEVHSCIYACSGYWDRAGRDGMRWIGWQDDEPYPPWVQESAFPDIPVRGRLNNLMLQRAAAEAGLGLAYLPCFVGDPSPLLCRMVPDSTHSFDLWVLCHPDLREARRHRLFRDHIHKSLRPHIDLLEGRLPYGPEPSTDGVQGPGPVSAVRA